MISAALRRRGDAILVCDSRPPVLAYGVPVTTRSKLNERHGHWAQRSGSAKAQRQAARLLFPKRQPGAFQVISAQRLVVRLVRCAPRQLDDDNLAGALKSVRDGVADALGVNDRDERVQWVCDQEAARVPHVLVEVYAL